MQISLPFSGRKQDSLKQNRSDIAPKPHHSN